MACVLSSWVDGSIMALASAEKSFWLACRSGAIDGPKTVMKTFTQHDPLTDIETQSPRGFPQRPRKGGRVMAVESLDGFFAAFIAGPETVIPSEYYPEVFGGVSRKDSGPIRSNSGLE